MTKIYYFSRLFPNNTLRDDDEKIIENIIGRIKEKSSTCIKTIAKVNFTSQSSISRLAKRAGFNNYKEFIFFLTTEFSLKNKNQLENLPFVLADQDWEKINDYFENALTSKKIYLYGEGFCQFLVDYTYRKLLLKKIYAIDLEGVEISLISDDNPHTLITFSQSGENKQGLIKMKECKNDGGTVIAITATENSSYVAKSDLSFVVERGNTGLDHENQHLNYFFGNALNLIEYLINQYTKKPNH
ncbi:MULTISPECIES: MurR/RpiR family transcriptional regulator [Carnobacterium]|uniref:MurR/RpiR family transcriptional regulator n=1 Tax=Carnobacterium divergens TaxID=2748 RepID=A0A2R7ZUW6_CARDV|nr:MULTISPECIES: SIS domain-containing protein [Carnobacterium]MCO6018783.1 SIS domain-containing protein [Carnobacterium divergens]MDT1939625.1 SIS domain-containing protein [Carnobacterium divergens]MDT1942063.1 SIS domain-containing protein [Carnobacterium divergens]MDT1947861.1 SIS domain-containing protein [Carnobacterium divergens]MDT1950349.1 SIS domain-containing protein [Carnobacterium divergens]